MKSRQLLAKKDRHLLRHSLIGKIRVNVYTNKFTFCGRIHTHIQIYCVMAALNGFKFHALGFFFHFANVPQSFSRYLI